MGRWIGLVILGILSIVAGVLALLNPFPASLVAVKLAGWALLILGGVQMVEAFRADGWTGRLWSLLIGVVALIAGINLLGEPLQGLLSLTMIIAVLFIVSGLFKLIAGSQIQRGQLRMTVFISGVVSLLLGGIILTNFPASAATSLGILLGIELISNGVSSLALGWVRKTLGAEKSY